MFKLYSQPKTAKVPKKCGPPPEYPYTRLSQTYAGKQSFSSGEKVSYKCAEDFRPYKGSKTVECSDGKWSRLALKCESKSLDTLIFKKRIVIFGSLLFNNTASDSLLLKLLPDF